MLAKALKAFQIFISHLKPNPELDRATAIAAQRDFALVL